MKITKYQIFGERNSGTNYLDKVLQFNLLLKPTIEFGYKHWFIKNHFPRGKKNSTTDNECLSNIKNSNDTLFIFIVREPISWLQSMHRTPWHAPEHRELSFSDFIRKEWIAYEATIPQGHEAGSQTPWYPSKDGKYLIESAKNICDLRNLKNEHFLSLDGIVKNFFIIRQESLSEDLKLMFQLFKLRTRFNSLVLPEYRLPIQASAIEINDLDFIESQIDHRIENILGYKLDSSFKIANY